MTEKLGAKFYNVIGSIGAIIVVVVGILLIGTTIGIWIRIPIYILGILIVLFALPAIIPPKENSLKEALFKFKGGNAPELISSRINISADNINIKSTSLVNVEGIGKVYARKLERAGIRGTVSLLKSGATKRGRQEIARVSGVSHSQVLRWVNHVDLFRVKGVSGQDAELLEAAGVDSVPELGQRNAKQLIQKLAEVNRKKNLVNVLPNEARVESWISQAKRLKKVINF